MLKRAFNFRAVALDDEIAIELCMSDFDILHAKQFAQAAEQAISRHAKPKVVGVDISRAKSSERDGDFAGMDVEQIERDGPVVMADFDFVALPGAAFHEIATDFLAEFLPDFFDVWTEEPFEEGHGKPRADSLSH